MNDRIKVTVYKRKATGVWYMQYRDPVSGIKRQKSTATKRKTDANRIARDWEKEVNAGKSWKDGDINWQEFRDRFEAEHLEGLAEKSLEKANSVLDSFERIISPKTLAKVNAQTLSRYQQRLRDDGRADATIKGHLAYLRSALGWAKDQGLIFSIPVFPKVKRAQKSSADTPMKGRPLTLEEFERMLMSIGKVITKPHRARKRDADGNKLEAEPDTERIDSWERLLRGLWLSGLRLGEAMELRWNDPRHFSVVTDQGLPKFSIPGASQKSNKNQLVPMTPDFAEFILTEVPERQRRGFVFEPLSMMAVHGKDQSEPPARMKQNAVGKIIGRIGKAASVVVMQKKTDEGETLVFASAHDLRRSFGERWSERVMPKILKELMRHGNIETTMRFYVGQNAERTAELLWSQFGGGNGSSSGTGSSKTAGTKRK